MENMVKAQKTPDRSFWKNRRVLITGGEGFVGTWLSSALLDLGSEIYILGIKDKPFALDPSIDAALKKAAYIQGDVRHFDLIAEILAEHKIQTVFHLAAQAIVGKALENPKETLDINIAGTWNILEASRKADEPPDVILASSDKAYGEQAELPYTEASPLLGRNPYDCSKSCADMLGQMYAGTYGLGVAITRCGNIYGGGDPNFSRLIPDTIRAIFHGEEPVIRSDGLFKRDYVYIKDVVSAYASVALALGKDKGKISGEAFNFGNNRPYTILEVVEKILKLMNKTIEPKILNSAKAEIRDQYLDARKAKAVLGWEPAFTFDEGLKETVLWYQDFFKNTQR